MVAKSRKRKQLEQYFDLYAENWELVKHHPNLHVEPDVKDTFVCPLCMRFFTREALEHDVLSLEHVPPKKLNGKVRTISCKDCNSEAGSALDSHLVKQHQLGEVLAGGTDSTYEIRYSINGLDLSIPATLKRPDASTFQIIGDPKRTDPKALEKVMKSMENQPWDQFRFNMQISLSKPKAADVSRLRIAYLWAFSVFGYGFLLNPNLAAIRGQIKYPDKDVLPVLGVTAGAYAELTPGVYIISKPTEFKSFLVAFDLKAPKGLVTRYVAILPGPAAPGLNIYHWLSEHQRTPFDIQIDGISEDIDFLETPFIVGDIWNNFATRATNE